MESKIDGLQSAGDFLQIKVDILFVCGKKAEIKFVERVRKVLDFLNPPVSSKIMKIKDVEETNVQAKKTVSVFNTSLDVARLFVEMGITSEKHNCCVVQKKGEVGFGQNSGILNIFVESKENFIQWWPQVFIFLCGRSKTSVSGPCFFMYDYASEPCVQHVHDFINACEKAGIHFATLQHTYIVHASRALIIHHSGWGCEVYEKNKKILDSITANEMPVIVVARNRLAVDSQLEEIANTIEPDLNDPAVLAWVLCQTKQVDHEMRSIHRGYPLPLTVVDKLLNCCFVVYGLVAAIVASAVMGVFLLIAAAVLLACGRWDSVKETVNKHTVFRVIFITHVLLYCGTIGLLLANYLVLEFSHIYSVPFYIYSVSFGVIFLRFILVLCLPWHARWPLRGITGSGKLFF